MADKDDESRGQPRLRLELPVEAQVNGGGYKDVQIVDISPTGLQLWTDEVYGEDGVDPADGRSQLSDRLGDRAERNKRDRVSSACGSNTGSERDPLFFCAL